MSAELDQIPTAELRRLLESLEGGELGDLPSAAALRACGFGGMMAPLQRLFGMPASQLAIVLGWVLSEREVASAYVSPELVFTRTRTSSSQARDTASVFAELCAAAEKRIFIAGYTFTAGKQVLAPLYRAMSERGVAAKIVLDCSGLEVREATPPQQVLEATVEDFLRRNWKSFGEPRPELFYDPLTCERKLRYGDYKSTHSMHAKCVIIDDTHALVGSANFSRRAIRDNIEVGVVVRDVGFVRRLIGQWVDAINEGIILAT